MLKQMLLFSHKMDFIELQSSVQRFDIAFAIKKFNFCGALFKRILAWKRGISKGSS